MDFQEQVLYHAYDETYAVPLCQVTNMEHKCYSVICGILHYTVCYKAYHVCKDTNSAHYQIFLTCTS